MGSLTGVWQSTDKRENRFIYVTRVSSAYAFGWPCDPRGLRHPGSAETRVELNHDGTALKRYRRPVRLSAPVAETSAEIATLFDASAGFRDGA